MVRSLSFSKHELFLPGILSFLYFAIQYGANAFHGYGYFVDELYYLSCASRPDTGYIDHPPFSILLLKLIIELFGDSLAAIRLLPAAAGAGTVFLTGAIARRFGGGNFAVLLSIFAVIGSPVLLVLFGFYSMNSLEVLLWNGIVLTVIILLQDRKPKLWILVGVLAGIGMENKHTFAVFVIVLLAAILLTLQFRQFLSPYLWLGGLIAFAILTPNLFWEIRHDWVSLEFYRNATVLKNLPASPVRVIVDQILSENPGSVFLWLAGIFFFFRQPKETGLRIFGWIFVILLGFLILAKSSRPDRIAAAYPVLFAGGACLLEKLKGRWIMPAALTTVVVTGIAFLPAGLPVLPPGILSDYASAIGVIPQIEKGKAAALPQWFGDRFDWEKLYESVQNSYDALPPDLRKETVVLGRYYGHAGAIEHFGRGSIPVISGHNSYYLWGNGKGKDKAILAVGFQREELETVFRDVKEVGKYSRRFTNEKDVPIYLCQGFEIGIEDFWKKIRFFV
ncbi:hypothetical protein EHO60_16065 [Leptospira fletcheri]|uniref:Glycosyltransferase RgtA/B/C/D-like domain-containing protein n=1 Tax=Leptospira fletcheri TaxID=2484981 RepID=A0A4R9G6Y3_9LEPT|nr:glycosyltransferase family 39 protein [Leptospira fletcheri]TGK06537.1 hypothetical protein EHO60_16065 [Leptospira fletcheri]